MKRNAKNLLGKTKSEHRYNYNMKETTTHYEAVRTESNEHGEDLHSTQRFERSMEGLKAAFKYVVGAGAYSVHLHRDEESILLAETSTRAIDLIKEIDGFVKMAHAGI